MDGAARMVLAWFCCLISLFPLPFIGLFNRTLQIATLQILCGVAKVIEARSLTHRGAFADCLERVRGCLVFVSVIGFSSEACFA